jgi:hypothetical protein
MDTIKMTVTHLEKNPNTKTTYLEVESKVETIDRVQYARITGKDTLKWFRRMGGSEYAKRKYTSQGYLIVKLVSTSPDKQNKTIRTFEFN